MSAVLTLPASFGAHSAAEWMSAWRSIELEPELEIVLPAGCFVRPGGVALLASGVAWRNSKGLHSRITPEHGSEDSLAYLQRIDFFTSLGVGGMDASPRVSTGGRFVELRSIVDLPSARALAEKTASFLETQLPGISPSPLRAARFALEELGANIVQHSESPETGFGLAQAFPARNAIELAFADRGIGFLRSLQKNAELAGRLEDDGEALQLALEEGVTSNPHGRRNMGVGLAQLRTFSDLLDGELWIASGSALLRRRTVVANKRATTVHRIDAWQGSWICLEAPVGAPPSTLPRTEE
jgi:anti-sigma regulatory factor (Ser/Thr protein kinase)